MKELLAIFQKIVDADITYMLGKHADKDDYEDVKVKLRNAYKAYEDGVESGECALHENINYWKKCLHQFIPDAPIFPNKDLYFIHHGNEED